MTLRTIRNSFLLSLAVAVTAVGLVGCGSDSKKSSTGVDRRASSYGTEICIGHDFTRYGVYAQFTNNEGPIGNGPFRANGEYCGWNFSTPLTVVVYSNDNVPVFAFEGDKTRSGFPATYPTPVKFFCPPGGQPTHSLSMHIGEPARIWPCGRIVAKVHRPWADHYVVQLLYR